MLASRLVGRILTCCSTERKGKYAKNKTKDLINIWVDTITSYVLRRTIEKLADPSVFRPIRLENLARQCPHDLSPLLPASWGRIKSTMATTGICSPVGSFRRQDILCWQYEGVWCLGRAILFLEVQLDSGLCRYLGLMLQFEFCGGRRWNEHQTQIALVSVERFGPVFSWLELEGGEVEALLPCTVG